jgi:hypothetical protein
VKEIALVLDEFPLLGRKVLRSKGGLVRRTRIVLDLVALTTFPTSEQLEALHALRDCYDPIPDEVTNAMGLPARPDVGRSRAGDPRLAGRPGVRDAPPDLPRRSSPPRVTKTALLRGSQAESERCSFARGIHLAYHPAPWVGTSPRTPPGRGRSTSLDPTPAKRTAARPAPTGTARRWRWPATSSRTMTPASSASASARTHRPAVDGGTRCWAATSRSAPSFVRGSSDVAVVDGGRRRLAHHVGVPALIVHDSLAGWLADEMPSMAMPSARASRSRSSTRPPGTAPSPRRARSADAAR